MPSGLYNLRCVPVSCALEDLEPAVGRRLAFSIIPPCERILEVSGYGSRGSDGRVRCGVVRRRADRGWEVLTAGGCVAACVGDLWGSRVIVMARAGPGPALPSLPASGLA